MSVILWGPPGSGKTTIAHLVARATDRRFVAMSALTAGVKDVRAVIETARRQRRSGGPQTVLFIDEVHRFSKTQQDSLLAAVEDRTVTLLAATTENPYFSVISPCCRRCVLLTLQPLDDAAVRDLLRRAVADERGLGGALTLETEAEDHLVRLAAGDVRKALTALEAAAGSRHGPRRRADRPRHRRAGGRRGGRALRPGRRRALRRHQRLHQEHARLRLGRGAALAGPDAGRRRGRPVHRPPPGHLRQRGRRHGRPVRAERGHRRRPRRASTSGCPRCSSTSPRR